MSNEYDFLKATKPSYSKPKSKSSMVKWYGLNMNAPTDTGYIVDGRNFYVTVDGTLRAVDMPVEIKWIDGLNEENKPDLIEKDIVPLGFKAIDGYLFFIYNAGNDVFNEINTNVDIVRICDFEKENGNYSFNISHADLSNRDINIAFSNRSVARYNTWTGNSDVISGEYKPRLLIYPDKEWLSFNGTWGTPNKMQRYKIIQTVNIKNRIKKEIYKSGWSFDGDSYSLPDKPDDVKNSVSTEEVTETVYGYSDEEFSMPNKKETGTENVSYSVSEENDEENNTISVLTVETVTSITNISYSFEEDESCILPNAEHITPWNNRIFGVDGTKIFASAAGSYVDYDLDTAADFDENNAWYSATQSGGEFTHICTYGGRVTAFKKDMLYELYNDKNPFRIKEISRIGTFNGDSVHEVDSTLFYANKDGIYAYGGSYPRSVSDGFIDKRKLDKDMFTKCVAGSFDGKYYVRVPFKNDDTDNPVLVFDTATSTWSIVAVFNNDISYFAECDGKFFAVLEDGKIYLINSGDKDGITWDFETPVVTEGTADRKVLEKVQLLVKFHNEGSVKIFVKYDNGVYEQIGKIEKESGIHPLYCKIRKSDNVIRCIKFECEGDVEILTFEQILSAGGNR